MNTENKSRPNILLIMADQLSADAMSCRLGREYLHTPSLDNLAGVVSRNEKYC